MAISVKLFDFFNSFPSCNKPLVAMFLTYQLHFSFFRRRSPSKQLTKWYSFLTFGFNEEYVKRFI